MKTSKIFNTLWVLEKSLKMLFFSTKKIDTFPKSKIKRQHSLKRRPIKYQTAKNWEGIWLIFTLIHVLKMPKVNFEFFKKKSWVRKPVFYWLNELFQSCNLSEHLRPPHHDAWKKASNKTPLSSKLHPWLPKKHWSSNLHSLEVPSTKTLEL
jgi:hypothetical protein